MAGHPVYENHPVSPCVVINPYIAQQLVAKQVKNCSKMPFLRSNVLTWEAKLSVGSPFSVEPINLCWANSRENEPIWATGCQKWARKPLILR